MNCRQAQRLADDLASARLAEPVARQVRQHLVECTDCRVLRQRSARLQQLLALKRHEQPDARYLAGIVEEFHARLAAAESRRRWWTQLAEIRWAPALGPWRYGLAGACGLGLLLVLTWIRSGQPANPRSLAGNSAATDRSPVLIAGASVPALPAGPQFNDSPWPASSEVSLRPRIVLSAADRTPPDGAHYVLDRIAVTPASYDVATVDF